MQHLHVIQYQRVAQFQPHKPSRPLLQPLHYVSACILEPPRLEMRSRKFKSTLLVDCAIMISCGKVYKQKLWSLRVLYFHKKASVLQVDRLSLVGNNVESAQQNGNPLGRLPQSIMQTGKYFLSCTSFHVASIIGSCVGASPMEAYIHLLQEYPMANVKRRHFLAARTYL